MKDDGGKHNDDLDDQDDDKQTIQLNDLATK